MNEAVPQPENLATEPTPKAPNVVAWIGAFSPIWSELPAMLIFDNIQLDKAYLDYVDTYKLLVVVICNLVVFLVDDFILKKKKVETKLLEKCVFIFPLYLWERSKLNKDNKAYFICWCVAFVIAIFLF